MGSDEIKEPGAPAISGARESSLADMLKSVISRPTDPRALNVPDPTPPPPRDLLDEVAEMFSHRQAGPAGSPTPPPAPVAAPVIKVDLLVCPKCQAKLSSLDNKMNQCFRCRVRLVDDEQLHQSRGPISIGI